MLIALLGLFAGDYGPIGGMAESIRRQTWPPATQSDTQVQVRAKSRKTFGLRCASVIKVRTDTPSNCANCACDNLEFCLAANISPIHRI